MKIETMYNMGDKLKDMVTGFIGIVNSMMIYEDGSILYGLSSKTDDMQDGFMWIHRDRLIQLNEGDV